MSNGNDCGGKRRFGIALLAFMLIGSVISCSGARGERGEWPDIPSPTQAMEGQPQMMVSQRLSEIKMAVQNSTAPAEIKAQVTGLCDQVMAEHPADPESRADEVHRAHMATMTTPPNWATVIEELGGNQ